MCAKAPAPYELIGPLQGFNTKWCIAGEGCAEGYLAHSDVLIYFSKDAGGQNTIPRACIVSGENGITEVRGIINNEDVKQHLDSYITPVVDEKLKEMQGGEKWQESMKDMKQLARIDREITAGAFDAKQDKEELKNDLVFLYELDKPIQSAGYGRDPRIQELRAQRNKEEDMPIIFECSREQIARVPDDINENTKAYVGEWNPTIFQTVKKFPNIKHLYESFPEKKIFRQTLETNPNINSSAKAEEIMIAKNIHPTNWGRDILYKTEFSHEGKTYELVRFTVEQLGFPSGATTEEILDEKNLEKLGLSLCPAEVGPHLRLQYSGGERMLIAMKQIAGRDGDPRVFGLYWDSAELELYGYGAGPLLGWGPDRGFVLCSRKET